MPAEKRSEGEPIRVAVIGGGISGIAQTIRLREALGDRVAITVFEKRSQVGGIWRDCQWPGSSVDVPIHLYSLYSDLKCDWPRVYAYRDDVFSYWLGLVEKHQISDTIQFNTTFLSSSWSEVNQEHTLILSRDSVEFEFRADVLISAVGPLAKPVIPSLPGLDKFSGDYFHNLAWDPSIKLEGKRVAVIGNGGSGIQVVPGVAALPGVTLTHFIRSAGHLVPKINPDYSAFAVAAFKWIPGIQRLYRCVILIERHRRHRALRGGVEHSALQRRSLAYIAANAPSKYLKDLTPQHAVGCKRLGLDAGWLKSLHRDNVELVASKIVRIVEDGLVTEDGRIFPLDVIIFATGANILEFGLGLNAGVKGEEEGDLKAYWKSIGAPKAYLGLSVPKFPNYFITIGPGGNADSYGYTLGNQTAAIARLIKAMVDYNLSSIQPSEAGFKIYCSLKEGSGTPPRASPCTGGGAASPLIYSVNTAFGLWWQTRAIDWNVWSATAISADGSRFLVDPRTFRGRTTPGPVLAALVPLLAFLAWTLRDSHAMAALWNKTSQLSTIPYEVRRVLIKLGRLAASSVPLHCFLGGHKR